MHRYLFLTAVAILMFFTVTRAQDSTRTSDLPRTDLISIGFGFGQDYGFIGGNLTVYPQENIGLFIGFGYAIAGFGYNAGIKFRALPNRRHSLVRPFILAMYGYNAAVAVTNYQQDNKIFYGPTVGGGVDLGPATVGKGYLSLALLVPIRNSDAADYINQLRSTGVTFNGNLSPITLSIGYKFILN